MRSFLTLPFCFIPAGLWQPLSAARTGPAHRLHLLQQLWNAKRCQRAASRIADGYFPMQIVAHDRLYDRKSNTGTCFKIHTRRKSAAIIFDFHAQAVIGKTAVDSYPVFTVRLRKRILDRVHYKFIDDHGNCGCLCQRNKQLEQLSWILIVRYAYTCRTLLINWFILTSLWLIPLREVRSSWTEAIF